MIAAAILVAFGCVEESVRPVADGAKKIEWVQQSQAEIQVTCGGDIWTVAGCYRWDGDVCRVYTRLMKSETDKVGMGTLGHEVRHCFAGNFHLSHDY